MENRTSCSKLALFAVVIILAISFAGCGVRSRIPSVDDVKPASKDAKKNSTKKTTSTNPEKTTSSQPNAEQKFMDAFAQTPAHQWMILLHSAGKVRIGDTKEVIYQKYPKESLRFIEPSADDTGTLEVYSGGEPAIIIEFDNDKTPKARRLRIKDFRLRTKEEIHVGSTAAELKKAYKELEYKSSRGQGFAISFDDSLSFVMDPSKIPKAWFKDPKADTLPDDVPIIEILVL